MASESRGRVSSARFSSKLLTGDFLGELLSEPRRPLAFGGWRHGDSVPRDTSQPITPPVSIAGVGHLSSDSLYHPPAPRSRVKWKAERPRLVPPGRQSRASSDRSEPPFRKSRSTISCNVHLRLAGWLIPIPDLFARVGHIGRRIDRHMELNSHNRFGEVCSQGDCAILGNLV
jgi:hypothetical protein